MLFVNSVSLDGFFGFNVSLEALLLFVSASGGCGHCHSLWLTSWVIQVFGLDVPFGDFIGGSLPAYSALITRRPPFFFAL